MSFIKTNYNPKPIANTESVLTSSQIFGERKVKSRFWYAIEQYSDLSFSSLANLLHMSSFFAGLEICMFVVWQIKSNASAYYITFGLPTIGHRYLYGEILPSFSWFQSEYAVVRAVFFVFLTLQILTILSSVYLLRRVKSEPIRKSDWSKSLSWLLSQIILLKCSIALGPVAELASIVIRMDPQVWVQVISVIFLLMIPVEIILNCALTYDYGFITTNLIQGRSYRYFIGRAMGLVLTVFLKSMWEGARTKSSDLLVNIVSVAVSFTLAYIQIVDNTYYWSPTLEKLSTFMMAFYCWESFDNMIIRLFPDFAVKIDHDYMTCTIMPLLYWCERNLLALHRRKIGNLGSHLGHKSATDGVFYLELLYGAFRNFKVEENAFMVGSSLSRHTTTCKDPLCLCFFLRANVDLHSGYPAGQSARELADRTLGLDRRNANDSKEGSVEATGFGKLCTINLQEIISEYKSNHQKVAKIEIAADRTSLKMTQVQFDHDSEKMNYVLNLQDAPSYLAAILGFFRSLIKEHSKSNNFDAVFGFLRFAIGEYGSCLSALLVLYDYVYSVEYSRQVTMISDFLMLNLRQQARRKLAEEDSEDRKSLENKTITQVLALRKRVQTLSKATMEAIVNKRDLYDNLVMQHSDSDKAYQAGKKQHHAQNHLESEFSELISGRTPNIELLKSAIHYEMFVLEKKSAPRSLLKRFKELSQEFLQRTTYDPVDGIPVLKHASPYTSDHVVVLTKFSNNSYRISHHTDNALELFSAEGRDLQGRKISDFMPKEFGDRHDLIVNTFLNGQSKSKFNSEIPTVMITESGVTKSITVIPRVEAVFTEEIYIGALIQNRNQLALSTTVTSLGGRVQNVGRPCSQFKWTLQEGDSIFRVVPGLFHSLYPQSRNSFSKRMRKAEERVNEVNTLRPPDFEKNGFDPSTRSFGGDTEYFGATRTLRGAPTQTVALDEGALTQTTMFNPQVPEVQPGQTVTILTEVFMYCFYDGVPSSAAIEDMRKTDALYSVIADKMTGWKISNLRGDQKFFTQLAESDLEHSCRVFQHDREIFANNLEFAQKVCLKIDTHYYEQDLAIREISVLKSDNAGARHYLFFQTLASKAPKMIGILSSISPDTVEELNRYWLQAKKTRVQEGNRNFSPGSMIVNDFQKIDTLASGANTSNSPPPTKLILGRGASLKIKPPEIGGSGRSLNFKLQPKSTPLELKLVGAKNGDQPEGQDAQSLQKSGEGVDFMNSANKNRVIRQKSAGQNLGNKQILERTEDDEDSKSGLEKVIPITTQEFTSLDQQEVVTEQKPAGNKLYLKTKTDGTAARTDMTPHSGSAGNRLEREQSKERICEEINKLSEVEIPQQIIDYLAHMIEDFKASNDKKVARINLYAEELDQNADKAGSSAVDRQEIRMDARARAGHELEDQQDEGNKTVKYSRDTEQRTEKQLEELRKLEEMDIQVTSNMISTVRSKNAHHHELQHIRKVMKLRLNSASSHLTANLICLLGILVMLVWLILVPILSDRHSIIQNNQCDTLVLLGSLVVPFSKSYKTTSKGMLTMVLANVSYIPATTEFFPESDLTLLRDSASQIKVIVRTYKSVNEDLNLKLRSKGFQYQTYTFFQRMMAQSDMPAYLRFNLQSGFYALILEVLDMIKRLQERKYSQITVATQLRRLSMAFYASTLADLMDFQDSGLNVAQVEVWPEIGFLLGTSILLIAITILASNSLRSRKQRLVEVMQHVDFGKCEDARIRLSKSLHFLQNVRNENRDLEENLEILEESIRRRQALSDRDDPGSPDESRNEKNVGDSRHADKQEPGGVQTTNGPLLTEGPPNEISFLKGPPRQEAVEISIAPLEDNRKDKPARNRLGRDSSNKNLQGSGRFKSYKKRIGLHLAFKEKRNKLKLGTHTSSSRRNTSLTELGLLILMWVLAYLPLLIGALVFNQQIQTMEQKLWAASVLYTDVSKIHETIGLQYSTLREYVFLRNGSSVTNPTLRAELEGLLSSNLDKMGSDLTNYFNGEYSFLNQAVRSKVICDSPTYNSTEKAACNQVISNYRDTLFEGMQQYIYSTKLSFFDFQRNSYEQLNRSFSKAQSLDLASEYFDEALSEVTDDIVASARSDLATSITLLSALGYVFILLVGIVLVVHRLVWIPKATEKFQMIFSTLLVLNDEILINPYLMQFLVASSNSNLLR